MSPNCQICASAQRDAIDGRLAAGGRANSLRRIAADFGFSLRVVWKHSRHQDTANGNAPGNATSELRKLLRDHRRLYDKALRAGNLDVAARQLGTITDLELRLAAPPPKSGPRETRFVVCYDDPVDRPQETVVDERERNAAITGIREALGYTPEAARRRFEPGQQKPLSAEERDRKLVDDLVDAVERHQSDERFIASAMRVCAILKREQLPATVEAEIDRLEGNHGDIATLPRDDAAEGEGVHRQPGGNDAA